MTSKSENTTETTANPLAQLQDAGFGNMMGISTAWMETLSDMSAELLGFVADRIKEDVKTQHQIMHCKSVGELQHVQAEFLQKALDQYHDETGKLVQMSAGAFVSKDPNETKDS